MEVLQEGMGELPESSIAAQEIAINDSEMGEALAIMRGRVSEVIESGVESRSPRRLLRTDQIRSPPLSPPPSRNLRLRPPPPDDLPSLRRRRPAAYIEDEEEEEKKVSDEEEVNPDELESSMDSDYDSEQSQDKY